MEEQSNKLSILDERVQQDLGKIKTELPQYSELSEEEQQKVKKHMESLNERDIRSINKYGRQIFEQSDEDREAYLQTLTNGEMEIGNIQAELLSAFEQEKPNGNIFEKALFQVAKVAKREVYRQKNVSETIAILSEKQEKLRNELEQHYYRLEQMAIDSAKERHEIELLIIAAKQKYEEIMQEIQEIESKEQQSFEETERLIQLKAFLNKLGRKIEGDQGRLIATTSRAITARYLAQGVDEAAYCFEQDMELAKPELRSMAIFSKSRQIVTGAVETYEKFKKNMNEMARYEAKKSVETLKKVKEIQSNPLYEVETMQEICRNAIEASKIVREYHESQRQMVISDSQYEKIYKQFAEDLQVVIGENATPQMVKSIEKDDGERE